MKPPKKNKPATARGLAKIADLILAPEGWTREVLVDRDTDGFGTIYPAEKTTTVVLTSESAPKVRLVFRVTPSSWGGPWEITGTTAFETGRGWVSFDRRGIDNSFYVTPESLKKGATFAGIAQAQIDRVRLHLEQDAAKVTVPGLPIRPRRTPEQVEEIKARLKNGADVEFTPGGMGTGYRLSKQRSSYTRPADPETIAFFGVGPLWVSTFDYD